MPITLLLPTLLKYTAKLAVPVIVATLVVPWSALVLSVNPTVQLPVKAIPSSPSRVAVIVTGKFMLQEAGDATMVKVYA